MSADLIIGVVFSLVGSLLVVIGLFILARTRVFISKSREVKGTVIRMVSSFGSEGGTVYAPVFKFTTLQGQVVEVEEKVFSNPPEFTQGQVVDILYDPENPSRARVKKWFNLYFVPILLGGLGIIFGGIGVVMLVVTVIHLFR